MKHRIITFCIFAAFAANATRAENYYVSSKHVNRNDLNEGTLPSAPWATINKVANEWIHFDPGDTIYVERGSVFNEDFSHSAPNTCLIEMYTGGSAGLPITLTGSGYGTGARPVIRRIGGTGTPSFINIQKSHITVTDLELDGGYIPYGKYTPGITVGGDQVDISNIQIRNLKIHNLGGSPTNYVCGIWVVSFTSNIVSDCLIEGNEISGYSAHGINHYSPGPLIHITWRDNIVNNAYAGGRYSDANSALQISSGSLDCLFEHNYLQDTTTTEGIILAFGKRLSDMGTNTICYNIITRSASHGIVFTRDHYGHKLLYNICENIIYDNAQCGIAIHPADSYGAGTHLNIYNNTFFKNNKTDLLNNDSDLSVRGPALDTTICIFNNLFCHFPFAATTALSIHENFEGTLLHGNNLYWHTGGSTRNIVYDRANLLRVADVKRFEASAQNTDPLFRDASAVPTSTSSVAGVDPDGLKPQADSPAVRAGTQGISSEDIDGTAILTGEQRDIGAYEIRRDSRISWLFVDRVITAIVVEGFPRFSPVPEYRTNLLTGSWVPMEINEYSRIPLGLEENEYILFWNNLPHKTVFFQSTHEP